MKNINFKYNNTHNTVDLLDDAGKIMEHEDVENMLGTGFTINQENESLIITVLDLYKVQVKNEQGAYTTLTVCPSEGVDIVYDALVAMYDNVRVLNPDNEVYKDSNESGDIAGHYIFR